MYCMYFPPWVDRRATGRIDSRSNFFYHRLMHPDTDAAVAELYRSDWGRIVATVIRLVGDFEVAEEAVQEAFAAGVNQWRNDGIPEFPRAWMVQTARHKAIDLIRGRTRAQEKAALYAAELDQTVDHPEYDGGEIADD